jgi:hypothetical protein
VLYQYSLTLDWNFKLPTGETFEQFITRVDAHAESIEEFCAANASTQENQATPRVGRNAQVANVRNFLSWAAEFNDSIKCRTGRRDSME